MARQLAGGRKFGSLRRSRIESTVLKIIALRLILNQAYTGI